MHDTYVLKVFLVNICHWREKTDNTQILVAKHLENLPLEL